MQNSETEFVCVFHTYQIVRVMCSNRNEPQLLFRMRACQIIYSVRNDIVLIICQHRFGVLS